MEERRDQMTETAEELNTRRKESDPSRNVNNRIFASGSTWTKKVPQAFLGNLENEAGSMNSISGSELPSTSLYSLNDGGVMVEELTVKKYRNSHLPVLGSSNGIDSTQNRPKSWQYLYQLTGGSKNGRSQGGVSFKDKEPVASSGIEDMGNGFSVQNPRLLRQSNQELAKTSGCSINGVNNITSNTTLVSRGTPKKFRPTSGFSQVFSRNSLNEKGLLNRYSEPHERYGVDEKNQENENAVSVTRASSGASPDLRTKTSYLPQNSVSLVNNRISLREWLNPGGRKFNKSESLYIFRQIVDLVDYAHSQQVALDVRPSSFLVSQSSQIKYVGRLVQRGILESGEDQGASLLEKHSSRKRYLEQGVNHDDSLSSKNKKSSESMNGSRQYPLSVGYGFNSETDKESGISFGAQTYGFHTIEQNTGSPSHKTQNRGDSPSATNSSRQQLASQSLRLEENWYTSPENLNDNKLTLPSNIYCLGMLLFELFCCFKSPELQVAAMSDLRHRILPPYFLSECPREAGFCLWLLHPEPSSRPTTREVLHPELIFKSQELASENQLSSSIGEEDVESDLMLHFLATLKEKMEKQETKLVEEIGCLEADFDEVEKRHLIRTSQILPRTDNNSKGRECFMPEESLGSEVFSRLTSSDKTESKLMRNINQLENAYFSMRSQIEHPKTDSTEREDKDLLKKVQTENEQWIPNQSTDQLGSFFDGLCRYARYSKFEQRATLRNSDLVNSSNVICSLSFDRDEEYFAAAGISKKIKIFEFNALLNDSIDIHYPVIEIQSNSKLSCVCWNSYIKNYLASTDYDGVVQLWDVNTGKGFSQYREHGKRAWSVDFSKVDPTKLASGSDDCSVKLWSINDKKCISTIRSLANVCSVQFSAHSTHLLSFGSADYKTYCYDLRYTRTPWCTLVGHGRTVSDVKFLDSDTLVSASTDNTLKCWDLKKTTSDGFSTSACSLTFTGHSNEKNFVGLSVCDGYIACGSETNEVYAYYRSLPMPITSHKFSSADPISGQETGDDAGQFVASVCWRNKSNMVVAANSLGSIKLLELV